jgi:hypothetical protein
MDTHRCRERSGLPQAELKPVSADDLPPILRALARPPGAPPAPVPPGIQAVLLAHAQQPQRGGTAPPPWHSPPVRCSVMNRTLTHVSVLASAESVSASVSMHFFPSH